ncbi:hypothetical protein GCM10023351_01560 [Microbacterium gilvum]|uniref:Uncharacterized protein n=1 Tax=Microbacterium gilvum TaxID=1336204 RepID=A0ABP8ZQK8_9MICO
MAAQSRENHRFEMCECPIVEWQSPARDAEMKFPHIATLRRPSHSRIERCQIDTCPHTQVWQRRNAGTHVAPRPGIDVPHAINSVKRCDRVPHIWHRARS